jgi:hypothetical protein
VIQQAFGSPRLPQTGFTNTQFALQHDHAHLSIGCLQLDIKRGAFRLTPHKRRRTHSLTSTASFLLRSELLPLVCEKDGRHC